ncbi:MAG TPA: hypothetical protein VF613_07445 [Longimicrobium sp.]|jgi:hypothetical protein
MNDESTTLDQAAAERFVDVLTSAGWNITGEEAWRDDLARGINVEAVLDQPGRALFMHYVPRGRHVSVVILDEDAHETIEFGFGFSDESDLEEALRTVVAVQDTVLPGTASTLLRSLHEGGRALSWEVQGQQEEDITPENMEVSTYRLPLP